MVIEELIMKNGGRAIRRSSKLRAIDNIHDLFDRNHCDKYPYLEMIFDPMITFIRILEFLSLENKPLSAIKDTIPKNNMMSTALHCSSDEKAAIMRNLTTAVQQKKIELIDGIRIVEENAWILIMPDAINPTIHLFAEGKTADARDGILEEYSMKIKKQTSGLI